MTSALLATLKAQLAQANLIQARDKPAIWAALTLGFYCFRRGGEFTTTSTHKYSRSHQLCRRDITMATNRSYFTLTIKASKTNPYRASCRFPVAATHTITCPVRAMRAFLRSRRHSFSLPLFTLHSGKYLTRSHLRKIMRGLLQAAGLTPTQASQYSSHRGRGGRTPQLAHLDGVPLEKRGLQAIHQIS